MFGNLSAKAMEHLLHSQLVGRIGCHAGDVTYIVPICYGYDGNSIYARTFEGMKLRMMRENPKVCFQLEHLESMGKWQSVVCWGEFEELTDTVKRNNGIEILNNRVSAVMGNKNLLTSPHWPFSLDNHDNIDGIIFCIHITSKTGKFEQI